MATKGKKIKMDDSELMFGNQFSKKGKAAAKPKKKAGKTSKKK